MPDKRLLLLSNGSELVGETPSRFATDALKDFFGAAVRTVFFVPFASVTRGYDEYTARVRQCFGPLGYGVQSAHEVADAAAAAAEADAVAVGGGNTFHLLRAMYETGLVEAIRARVGRGAPYVGWSAGSNVACPTIRTTNDMPIVAPPSLDALGLVPFQINPHYTDQNLAGHHGETRDERLAEFVHANPGVHVVGLREGTMLRVEGRRVELLGGKPARLFFNGRAPADIHDAGPLELLLR